MSEYERLKKQKDDIVKKEKLRLTETIIQTMESVVEICDCEYKTHCHYGRQYLQDLFRSRDPNRTIYDCEFHGYITEKLKRSNKVTQKRRN